MSIDQTNELGEVKVLQSPFSTAQPTAAYYGEGEQMRSWQTIGKPSVNSAFGAAGGNKGRNADINGSRYFLGVDWFEATLTGYFVAIDPDDVERPLVNSAFDAPAGCRSGQVLLYHNQHSRRNRHYRYGFDVLFVPSGRKVTDNREAMVGSYKIGVLAAVPYEGNNCKPGSSIFQAENNLLYRSDLWDTVDATFAALNASVSHITRLDIALDGFGLLDAADGYFRDEMGVKLGYMKKQALAKVGKAGFKVDRFEDGQVTNFYIGSMASKKALNGYAKGHRIDIENKQYIRKAWEVAGLITDEKDGDDVTRLEMRHRKEALDELNLVDTDTGELSPFDWRQLRHGSYLAGMFKESLRNFYGFKVVNHSDKDKSRWEDVPTIDWDAFKTAKVVRISRTRTPSETWRAKHASLKILRDDAGSDYLGDAVRGEILAAPTFEVTRDAEATLTNAAQQAVPTLSDIEARLLVKVLAGRLAGDAIEFVTAWSAESVPAAIAWAMAEEHAVSEYIERRLRNDTYDGSGALATFNNPQPLAVAA